MSDASQSRPCPDCASPVRAVDQSFCDSCGAFLRWDSPAGAASTESGSAAAPSAVSASSAPFASESVGTVREEPDTSSADAAPQPAAAEGPADSPAEVTDDRSSVGPEEVTAPLPAVAPASEAPAPAPTPVPEASPATEGPSDTLVRSLLVPVPGNRAAEPAVAAPVLPARPEAARPTVRAAGAPAPVQGGTPCPACSLANTPGRHFCRFCATPMVPEQLSTAEGPYAGRRPGLARDRSRWIVRALIVTGIVVVVVGGIVGGPPAVRAVQDHFAKRVPVHPVAWAASHSAPKQDARLAGDGYSNTWWGTGYAGDSAGQYMEARFAEPTDLLSVLITPGSSKNTTQADGQATPRTFELVVKDSSGETHVSQHLINDGGTQRVDVRVRDALTVQLVLRTAWRADPTKQVAVAELEFFGRSVS
ncbi:zinc ribbon domain-containing protein [Streptomyces sp. NBC_00572]|uniref:NADase-type glycan-binding domain-containing protein n=1 Tax=Streptomyces sp. NBC_00572 TaxID=2903664 RepID=UPI00225B528F|nr:zinc ribbon domain-containing protein [Streptomyces sp. NBC_00572]MCX4985670.1 zinc ribbon domain-containing protein [Streptomyces sp. NBC_00572]